MKLLHLFSNHRLTGPAELVLNLCRKLDERGWDLSLACGKPPAQPETNLNTMAQHMGIATRRGLYLDKHLHVIRDIHDVRRIAELLGSEHIDLLHVHMTNDHLVGGLAARRCGRAVTIVRSSYDAGGLKAGLRNRLLMARFTDALIVFSRMAAEADANRFGLDRQRVFLVDGAVDTRRFDRRRRLPPIRGQLGLDEADFVVGIVARIQPRRRFGTLLRAVGLALARVPRLKLLIVGRGTRMHQAAVRPARRLGLADRVVFGGYHRGDDYVRVLDAMDVKVFLVPGTDGTCRAVREAMAMGKPVIAARRGMLEEIVEHGRTGLLVDGSPEELAEAIVTIARDEQLRGSMARAALETAHKRFTLDHQVQQVEAAYRAIAQQQRA